MINEQQLKLLCDKYKIKYQLFHSTNIVLLDTGLDLWQIKFIENKSKPFCLLHKNRFGHLNKFHIHGWRRNLFQTIDSICTHKKVLVDIYGSLGNTYKNNKYKNSKNKGGNKYNCGNT